MNRRLALRVALVAAAAASFAAAWFSIRTYYSRYYAVAARQGVMSVQEHIERLERSLAYDPSYGYGNLLMAESLMKRGRLEEALAAQQRGMRSYRTVQAQLQLATILERLRRNDEARVAYAKALALAPSNVSALERLAAIAYAAGETSRVEELATEIARVDLNNPNPPYLRAVVAERRGDVQTAYRLYQKISAAGKPARGALYRIEDVRSRLQALKPVVEKR